MDLEFQVSGIVLAGGKSERMGTDKALLRLGNRTLLEHAVEKLRSVCAEVLVVAPPKKYSVPDARTIGDLIEGRGPLGGIYTGLVKAAHLWVLVLGCDLPLISKHFLKFLVTEARVHAAELDCIVPFGRKKGVEPLCAIYSKRCLAAILDSFENDAFQVDSIFPKVRTRTIPETAIRKFSPGLEIFFNVNSREDLVEAEKLWRAQTGFP